MNKTTLIAGIFILLNSSSSHGQGTFIYDQQSSTESNTGEGAPAIQSNQPIGQTFTPTFSSVGFIRLFLGDSSFNSLGATVYLNLRSDSISGAILGSTEPVTMPDRFSGFVNFYFSTPVPLTAGVPYCFQPVVQSGDLWQIAGDNFFNYAGGTAFLQGQPTPAGDIWFREGLYIPEPSAAALGLLGVISLGWARRKRFPGP